MLVIMWYNLGACDVGIVHLKRVSKADITNSVQKYTISNNVVHPTKTERNDENNLS